MELKWFVGAPLWLRILPKIAGLKSAAEVAFKMDIWFLYLNIGNILIHSLL